MNSSATAGKKHRDTLFVEDAEVVNIECFDDEQYVLRLQAPRCAAHATAGSFVHVRCSDDLPMRRPLSIMRRDAAAGWIEVLFKTVGQGLAALAARDLGDVVSTLGPIGRGFWFDAARPRAILIGGGVGIPPMIFWAEELQELTPEKPLVLMGSEIAFPFAPADSKIRTDWIPQDVNRTHGLLESWDVPARLASLSDFTGTYRGFVTDLARAKLETLTDDERQATSIYSCGPTPMLKAVAALACEFDIPCQVSLEEFMACAVGGCAGCTVLIDTDDGPAMRRVCVDGPVFDASHVADFKN